MMLNPLEVFNVLDPLSARVSFAKTPGMMMLRCGLFCQGLVGQIQIRL